MLRHVRLLAPWLFWLACSEAPNHAPSIEPVAPVTLHVGDTLSLVLETRDPDGDALTMDFTPKPFGATIVLGSDRATFTWAPLVSDTGPSGRVHELTFTASDGRGGVASRTVSITVLAQTGAPQFLGPEGYVLNLSQDDDLSFLVAVKDDDTSEVILTELSDPIPGARFIQLDGKTASFYWKPTAEQLGSQSYWPLIIQADDGVHATVVRSLSILLMNVDEKKGCAGSAPRLEACDAASCLPLADLAGAGAIPFRLDASDAESDLREVTLHFAVNNPLDPASYAGREVSLLRCDPEVDMGCPEDERSRYFIGTLASPAAASAEPLLFYYYVTAVDNDDVKSTTCDHTARLPKSGHFTLAAYPKQWTGACKDDVYEAAGLADAAALPDGVTTNLRYCVDDGADDFRIDAGPGATVTVELVHEPRHGALEVTLVDAAGTALPSQTGHGDRTSAVVDGPVYAHVAAPLGAELGDQSYALVVDRTLGACPNDPAEPNDTYDQAVFIEPGASRRVTICAGDHDIFGVSARSGESLVIDLAFQDGYGDLDVDVARARDGVIVARGKSAENDEHVVYNVVEDGTYYIIVSGYLGATNTGQLVANIVQTATLCVEDEFAPNAISLAAQLLPENTYRDLLVCPGQEDWFRVDVNEGERVTIAVAPYTPEGAPIDLAVFDDDAGTHLAGERVPVDDPNVQQWEVIAGVETRIRWRIRNDGPYTTTYDLAFGVEDAGTPDQCLDDRFSPLDTAEQALEVDASLGFLTRLKLCPGGEDWFRMAGAAFEESYIYVFGFSDEAPLIAELYAKQGGQMVKIADGITTTNGVEIRYLPDENVDLFIRVLGVPGQVHHYDLVFGTD